MITIEYLENGMPRDLSMFSPHHALCKYALRGERGVQPLSVSILLIYII